MPERALEHGADRRPKGKVGNLQVLSQMPGELEHRHDRLHPVVLVEFVPGGNKVRGVRGARYHVRFKVRGARYYVQGCQGLRSGVP